MLKALKRKTNGAADLGVQPWRPSFRNENRLPDVKVIRTSFFVNAGVTALLVFAVVAVAYVEYSLADLRGQISTARERIATDKAASDKAVASFRLFQEQERKAREVFTFMDAGIPMRDTVLRLGEILPADIALASLDVSETGMVLRGFVSGLPAKASGIASDFEKLLRESPTFGKEFDEISLTNIGRESDSGRMRFVLEMKRNLKKGKK